VIKGDGACFWFQFMTRFVNAKNGRSIARRFCASFLLLLACAILAAPRPLLAATQSPIGAQNPAATETASLPPSDHNPVTQTALPKILSDRDAALYRRVFAAQTQGDWRKARKAIKSISDDVLMGHVLYQRLMHPTHYRAKYKELKSWMDLYADHPAAMRVFRLALRRQPKGWRAPKRPTAPRRIASSFQKTKTKLRKRKVRGARASRARRVQMRRMENRVKGLVRRQRPTQALARFETKRNRKLFTPDRYDQTLGIIVRGY
jgi:soluble lytic murein transglycosylase